jgi:hypothetical protein
MKRLALAISAFSSLLLLASCATTTQSPAPTQAVAPMKAANELRSFLWVGNSFFYYNNSMHGHVSLMARAMTPSVALRGVSLTISGSGSDWHDVQSYLRPDAIGRYSFVGDNEIRFNPPGRQFDAVIMMDCSQCPVHPELKGIFHAQMKKHSDAAKANGVRPILFLSWAYKDKPEMTQQLADAYMTAAKANGAMVIPAGPAFAKAIAKRPTLELYQPDKRHPSLAGTYLAAATMIGTVTGQSPVSSTYTAGLDAELAKFLRETAWETVREFKQP